MNEGYVKRVRKCAKFLGVKCPNGMNILDFMDLLYEKIMEWEDNNQQEFPAEYMI